MKLNKSSETQRPCGYMTAFMKRPEKANSLETQADTNLPEKETGM